MFSCKISLNRCFHIALNGIPCGNNKNKMGDPTWLGKSLKMWVLHFLKVLEQNGGTFGENGVRL